MRKQIRSQYGKRKIIRAIEKVEHFCDLQPWERGKSDVVALIIFIIGAGLVLNGISIGARAESAMHQIYGGLYVVGGVMTIAIALMTSVFSAAVSAIKKLDASLKKLSAAPAGDGSSIGASRSAAAGRPGGEALPIRTGSKESYVECPACGRENRADARVCQCGNRLTFAA